MNKKMHGVTVYYFRMYDVNADTMVCSRRPATLEAIKRMGGTPIPDTAHKVNPSTINGDGFLKKEHDLLRPHRTHSG